jgi:hypothetical protein
MVTYVNDLRLSELATGEGSGTWGTTTNTNLELIGEALGYGTEQSFSSDADATTTIGDGVSDPARAMYFKVTSAGSLTATRTLTIAPNTISRVMFIENATSGSQSIAISQGSGASVTIATGKTAVVYLDGAGATAAVVDAMSGVDPGVTDTLTEVLVAGNTSGGTNIELSTTDKVQFRDAAIYLNSSVDGQLDIVSDTEIQIAATTIDVNGTLAFDSLKGTGATTVTNILDEDNMASDSATAIATQQSIKAYVDSQVGSFDTLAEVLAQGNTTGGTDLAVSTGDDITFADSSKAIFGAGSDLQIYHDASDSIINDNGTGSLKLQQGGSTKLEVTATGIDVTGAATFSGAVTAVGNMQTNSAGGVSAGARDTKVGTNASSAAVTWYDGVNAFATDGSYEIKGTTGNGLTLAPNTGAATFSGSVALAGSSGGLLLNDSATADNTIQLNTTGGTTFVGANGSAGNRFIGSSAYASTFGTTSANALELATNNTVRMSIAATGAAAFSGNVIIPAASILYFDGGGDTFMREPSANIVQVNTAGALAMTIDATQNVIIEGYVYPNSGIYLGGSVAANLLDDYEEGTWTPAYTPTTGTFTTITTVGAGSYTKVGRLVTVFGSVRTSGTLDVTGASGNLKITGLPFACNATAAGGGADLSHQSWNLGTDILNTRMSVAAGASEILMFNNTMNGSSFPSGNITVADMSTSGGSFSNLIAFTASYQV